MRQYCYTCYRPVQNCLCPHIKPFETDIHFVILMHPMEHRKVRIGTAKLAAACLKNSQIIVGIDFSSNKKVNELINSPNYHSVVLYPGANSTNISQTVFPLSSLGNKKLLVFVIDGTWPCALKIMKQSQNIQKLPKISFNPNKLSLFSTVKQQPHKLCLSTIESIHFLLDEFQREKQIDLGNKHQNLLEVLSVLLKFQVDCSLNPKLSRYRQNNGYKPVKNRKKSLKWEKRNFFWDQRK